MLLFDDDKLVLWEWHSAITTRLAQFRLALHPGAHPRPVMEGIPFLGFVVYPTGRKLKRRKVVHFRRRFRALVQDYGAGRVPLTQVTACVQGWVNHARYGNTVGLRKTLLNRITL